MPKKRDGEENANKVLQLCNDFEKDRDSLLAIYACGDNNGGYYMVGEPWKFSEGFYFILERGLSEDAELSIQKVAESLITGIRKLLASDSESARTFVDIISDDTDGEPEEERLDLNDGRCLDCPRIIECIKNTLSSAGIDVEIKVKNDRRKFLIGGSDVAS